MTCVTSKDAEVLGHEEPQSFLNTTFAFHDEEPQSFLNITFAFDDQLYVNETLLFYYPEFIMILIISIK